MNGSCTCTISNRSRAQSCFTRGPRSYERETLATDPVAGSPNALSPITVRQPVSSLSGRDEGATIRTSLPAVFSRSARGAICRLTPPGVAQSYGVTRAIFILSFCATAIFESNGSPYAKESGGVAGVNGIRHLTGAVLIATESRRRRPGAWGCPPVYASGRV